MFGSGEGYGNDGHSQDKLSNQESNVGLLGSE